MKILFCGDIVGRAGRDIITQQISLLRNKYNIDCVIANADNASNGFGLTKEHYYQLLESGIDVITGGDHIWDKKDILPILENQDNLLRPDNYPITIPGKGYCIFSVKHFKILVVHLMGQVFMKDQVNDPFSNIKNILSQYKLSKNIDAIFVDFHAEATSEKMAMAHFVDSKVSCVIGTHTHIPTADCHILPGGTAYQTDAGMCGDYNSIIGMQKKEPLFKFIHKIRPAMMKPAQDFATLCGVIIEIDNDSGLAKKISPIRIGDILSEEFE